MENLTGSEKQIKWAKDIITDIKKYTRKNITETRSSVIINLGKGVNNITCDKCLSLIEGFSFAEKNGLANKFQEILSDPEFDLMEDAVNKKNISISVFNAIYDGTYRNIKI